jgi:molecular chaperone GrpE (heat shock protein)
VTLVAVKDPEILAQLDGGGLKPVTDEKILFELENGGKPSKVKQIGRQVGLTARYGIEGLTAIPNMVGDAFGLDSTRTVSDWLTKLGLPQPEGAQERVVGDVTRAMAGAGGSMKLGASMAKSAGPVVSRVGEMLSSVPGSQVISAGAAGGGAGATREAGGGPWAQTAAGLAAGVVAPIAMDTAFTTVGAVGRGVKAALDPFSKGGREKVVGSTLKRFATNADDAVVNLANSKGTVPGSRPTTAQAAGDEGLLIAERGVASSNPKAGARLARRSSEQNEARNLLLKDMAGDEASLQAAKSARSSAAKGAYTSAFDEPITATQELLEIAKRPAVKDALNRAKAIAAEEGVDLGDPMTSVKGLHYVKMALDDTLDSSFAGGIGKTQKRAISNSRDELLKILDDLSPAYKGAREQFASQSKPVNQMETLQDVQGKVLNAGTDAATGERIMSASKFYNAVTKHKTELSKVLTKDQMTNLEAIGKDLDMAARSASSGKAAGSNTTQNISTAYVIGASLGNKVATNPIVQNLSRPLSWLNKLNEEQVQDLLVDAMLEPGLARSLMTKASPKAVESVGFELKQRAIAKGLGGLVGSSATVGRSQQEQQSKQR